MFTPLMAAIGMSVNEYLKPTGSCERVANRLKHEYWKVLLAGYLSKVVTTFFLMSFPGSMTKFIVGLVTGMFLNIFNSWRINVALADDPSNRAQDEGPSSHRSSHRSSNPKSTKSAPSVDDASRGGTTAPVKSIDQAPSA